MPVPKRVHIQLSVSAKIDKIILKAVWSSGRRHKSFKSLSPRTFKTSRDEQRSESHDKPVSVTLIQPRIRKGGGNLL